MKETPTEFRLVTNLPASGEAAVSDDEIRNIYRLRWGVELLWKFFSYALKAGQVNSQKRQWYHPTNLR
jgi:hypothetical protein